LWRNNNLSIVLVILFAVSLSGHALAGWMAHNAEERLHGGAAIPLATFLTSSEFGETVFENWESEFLQMAFYVILTVFLYQKGSAESKKHDGTDKVEEDPAAHRNEPDVPGPVRAGGWRLSVYKSSLSLALVALFLASFFGHAAAGARRYEEEQRQHGSTARVTLSSYLRTPQFWYESFQNWQSEFLAVLAIVVLSIRLRQWGSPESKPVHAPHSETGGG
jgi:uncharacterized protein DUF6766